MRYFTLQEAEEAIPELERIHRAVEEIRSKVADKYKALQSAGGEAPSVDQAVLRGQLEFMVTNLKDWLAKIERLGCVPKGLDPFLVDFPFRLEGREVYLCWRLGEAKITHYHGLEEGFAGRKPLPGTVHADRSR